MIELSAINQSFLIDQTKQDVEVEYLNGAVIGGWADMQDIKEIAAQYKRCADELVEKTSKDREFAFEYAYPIIYLYRHYLELRLKSIHRKTKSSHKFEWLLDNLLLIAKENNFPDWLTKALKDRVSEFKTIDNTSIRFRYGSEPEDEYIVNLNGMKLVIDDIEKVIETLEKL